jgi:hypothetical protein
MLSYSGESPMDELRGYRARRRLHNVLRKLSRIAGAVFLRHAEVWAALHEAGSSLDKPHGV